MTIGIDIDDTITETTLNANKYAKIYNPNLQDDYHSLPKEKYEEFRLQYQRKISETNPLKEGVKEAFDYFASNNIKVIIITTRDKYYANDIDEISVNHLKRNGLKFSKYINTTTKGIEAFNNNVDIFIDDKESNLDDVSSYNIECLKFSDKKGSKYKTFSNWSDIIKYIIDRKD